VPPLYVSYFLLNFFCPPLFLLLKSLNSFLSNMYLSFSSLLLLYFKYVFLTCLFFLLHIPTNCALSFSFLLCFLLPLSSSSSIAPLYFSLLSEHSPSFFGIPPRYRCSILLSLSLLFSFLLLFFFLLTFFISIYSGWWFTLSPTFISSSKSHVLRFTIT